MFLDGQDKDGAAANVLRHLFIHLILLLGIVDLDFNCFTWNVLELIRNELDSNLSNSNGRDSNFVNHSRRTYLNRSSNIFSVKSSRLIKCLP